MTREDYAHGRTTKVYQVEATFRGTYQVEIELDRDEELDASNVFDYEEVGDQVSSETAELVDREIRRVR